MSRPQLLFISPRFLFPPHSGGAIRTGQILRGMKGRRFHIRLLSPGSQQLGEQYRTQLSELADEWEFWPAENSEDRSRLSKARHLLSSLPLTVAADRSRAGRALVERALGTRPAVVVADFVHSAILLPKRLDVPTVVFTHNCEAEIYERHAETAQSWWMRAVWRSQAAKMRLFECAALARASKVVAVAERDAQRFERAYGLAATAIPTGVELDRFAWKAPEGLKRVVFTGSMDSPANVDGIEWMLNEVWPRVLADVPDATMTVVGKSPPSHLVRMSEGVRGWTFTGRVPDVLPYVEGADAFVIPLRVGGGTRMKAFEAMATGAPVVSTTVGVEGLGLEAGAQYLVADDRASFASCIVRLLTSRDLGLQFSMRARRFADENASHVGASRRFEEICAEASIATSPIHTSMIARGVSTAYL